MLGAAGFRVKKIRSLLFSFLFLLLFLLAGQTQAKAEEYLFWPSAPKNDLLKDGKLHIFLIGTGNPEFEMENIRKPSSAAVICDGEFFLIDAGEGAIQNIGQIGLPYPQIEKVFLTHFHSDHFAGVGQVVNASWIHGRKHVLKIYGPFGVTKIINAINTAYEFDAIYRAATVKGIWDPALAMGVPVEVASSDAPVVVYQGKELKVSAFRVDHTPVVPALGYIIEWRGQKIVFSGDTRIFPGLEKNAQGADILINEAFSHPLAEEVAERARAAGDTASLEFVKDISRYHSDSDELASMAQRAAVKRLVITHYVPAIPSTKKVVESFISGMQDKYKGEIYTAADRDEIVISKEAGKDASFEYKKARQFDIPVIPVEH